MVKENKKSMLVKAGAIGVAGLLIGGLGGAFLFPNTVVDVKYEVNPVDAELVAENGNLQLTLEELQLYVAELEAKEPEVVTETEEVIVEVDNENLAVVLEYLHDNDGDISQLKVDGLEDDELDLIVDRIVFMNDAEELAKTFLNKEFAEFAEDNFKKITDADEVKVILVDVTNVFDADFETYSDHGFMTADIDANVFFTYEDGIVESKTVNLEIINNRVRFK